MNILVCEALAQDAKKQLEQSGMTVDLQQHISQSQLEDSIHQYDGMIIGQHLQLDQAILAKASRLQLIGKMGKDINNIDVDAATAQGIAIVNTSTGVSTSIAEYTLSMMLQLARPQTHSPQHMGTELKGKTIGIIGLGNVGLQVAKRAKAFGMKVVCYDPSISRARAMMYEVEVLDFVDLLIVSDFITIHAPLNDKSTGLINKDNISLMKHGVKLIHTADSNIIVIKDLLPFLANGHIGGLAWDMPSHYQYDQPLLQQNAQVIITQNQAINTVEAQLGIAQEVVGEIIHLVQTGRSNNVINMPIIKENQQHAYQPLLQLSKILGEFIGQMAQEIPQKISIRYQGDICDYDLQPLTQTILQTSLDFLTTDKINYINVASWAQRQQIHIEVQQSHDYDRFPNYIHIEFVYAKDSKAIAGHVLSNQEIRIVQINQYDVDAKPEANFVLIPHENKPGKIGMAGTIMGDFNINIASMIVSRTKKNQVALMVMTVDQEISPQVIAALEENKGIGQVTNIHLSVENKQWN